MNRNRARVTPEMRDRIAELYLQGKTARDIETACGVSRHTVYRVIYTKGIKRNPDPKLLTFDDIRERLPISRGSIWRILHSLVPPTERSGFGGAHYYEPNIVQRVKETDGYKRAISHRIHKKYLRTHPEAYEQDKHIMRCLTCRFLSPAFTPDIRDYECENFRCQFSKIKNLPKRKSCGCSLWETKLIENERIK